MPSHSSLRNSSGFMSYLNVCDFHALQHHLKSVERAKVQASFDFIRNNQRWIKTAELDPDKFAIWVGILALAPSLKNSVDGRVWKVFAQHIDIDRLDTILGHLDSGGFHFPLVDLSAETVSKDSMLYLGCDLVSIALLSWTNEKPALKAGSMHFSNQIRELTTEQVLQTVIAADNLLSELGDVCLL